MMIMMAKLAFVPLLFIILAVCFLVAVLFSKAGRKVLFTGIIIVPILFMCLFFMHSGTIQRPVTTSQMPLASMVLTAEGPGDMPSVWRDGIEKEFRAEVYSSIETAAYGLGRDVAEKIKTLSGDKYQPILLDDPGDKLIVLEEFRAAMSAELADRDVVIREPAQNETPSAGQIRIRLEIKPAVDSTGGALEAVLQNGQDKLALQTVYDYQMWVWNYDKFKQANPDKKWLVFYSDTATDVQDARQQSMAKASQILTQQAGQTISPADIERCGLISREYLQKLWSSTGPIWRQALLVEADGSKLTPLVQKNCETAVEKRITWVKLGGSLLGMIVLVWVIYGFANAATKGYYSAILGMLAILLMMAFGFLLYYHLGPLRF